MSKNTKKVNPYEKKRKRQLKITRKQWIALISLLSVIAILVGIIIMNKLNDNNISDSHASHDHNGNTEQHYEDDGHNHGSTPHNNTSNANNKVNYQIYTNADSTSRLVFRDNVGKTVAEFDKITILKDRSAMSKAIDADKGVYELGWPTGSGANEFECVYYNVKTGEVSQKFIAPCGTDGARIACGNEDQTKVIVQDLFNKDTYYKEHVLKDAYTEGDVTIMSGSLRPDKKTVMVSYLVGPDRQEDSRSVLVNLYD